MYRHWRSEQSLFQSYKISNFICSTKMLQKMHKVRHDMKKVSKAKNMTIRCNRTQYLNFRIQISRRTTFYLKKNDDSNFLYAGEGNLSSRCVEVVHRGNAYHPGKYECKFKNRSKGSSNCISGSHSFAVTVSAVTKLWRNPVSWIANLSL